jgi:hypothetical protein
MLAFYVLSRFEFLMGCLGVLLEGHLSQDMGVPAMSKKPKASCQQSRLKFDKFYASV